MDKIFNEKNELVKEKYDLLKKLKIIEKRIKESQIYCNNNCTLSEITIEFEKAKKYWE